MSQWELMWYVMKWSDAMWCNVSWVDVILCNVMCYDVQLFERIGYFSRGKFVNVLFSVDASLWGEVLFFFWWGEIILLFTVLFMLEKKVHLTPELCWSTRLLYRIKSRWSFSFPGILLLLLSNKLVKLMQVLLFLKTLASSRLEVTLG